MTNKTEKIASILKYSDILKTELEAERDEAMLHPRFEGDEELLEQYYKKVLTSIYRVRNNAAALLLRNNCGCMITEDNTKFILNIDNRICEFPIPAIKNILQSDFDRLLEKNKREVAPVLAVSIDNNPDIQTGIKTMSNEKEEYAAKSKKPVMKEMPTKSNKFEKQQRTAENNVPVPESAFDYNIGGKKTELPDIEVKDIEENEVVKMPGQESKNTWLVSEAISNESDDDFFFFGEDTEINIPTKLINDDIPMKGEDKGSPEEDSNDAIWNLEDEFFAQESESITNNPKQEIRPEPANKIPRKFGNEAMTDKKATKEIPIKEISYENAFTNKQKPVVEHRLDDQSARSTIPEPDDGFLLWNSEIKEKTSKEDVIKNAVPDDSRQDVQEESFFKPELQNKFKLEKLKPEDKYKEVEIQDENKETLFFQTEVVDMDPEEMLEMLQKKKTERERRQFEEHIIEEMNKPVAGTVFDISTGKKQSGEIDVDEAANKINKLAEGVINTSQKDMMMDKRADLGSSGKRVQEAFSIQAESDYTRRKKEFLLDEYKISINICNEDGSVEKTDTAKLLIMPLKIPKSGTSLVTDIAVFAECNGEPHIRTVLPGGKTTITIKSEEYAIFVRGSWDDGDFISVISVIGVGKIINFTFNKNKIRPDSIKTCGIGHNVLYIDHMTVAHVLPCYFENNLYDSFVDLAVVIIRDYSYDQDCETLYTNSNAEVKINGERYKYDLTGRWDEDLLRLKLSTRK